MKNKRFLLIALSAVILLAFACSDMSGTKTAAPASKNCDEVLAQIGSSKVCLEDFQAKLDKIPPFYRRRVATKKGKLDYLNRLVEDELFYLDALSKGLDKDPEVVDQLDQIRKSILAGKVKKDMMEENTEPTEEDIKAYYDSHTDEFMSPETVTVRHILFRVKHKATKEEQAAAKKKADEVLGMIKGKKLSFKDAAKKYSEDKVSAKKGGELAPIKKGLKSAEFEKVAFGFDKADAISDVFKDRRGYNILQFVKKSEPEKKEFDKVKARIQRKIQQDARRDQMESFKDKLRETYTVTINEDLLVDEPGESGKAPEGLPLIGGAKTAAPDAKAKAE